MAPLGGETLLGRLRDCTLDMPWTYYAFEPTRAFEELRPLFEEEVALLEREEMDAWEAPAERVQALGLRLESPTAELHEFLLHIRGTEAGFRF